MNTSIKIFDRCDGAFQTIGGNSNKIVGNYDRIRFLLFINAVCLDEDKFFIWVDVPQIFDLRIFLSIVLLKNWLLGLFYFR